MCRVRQNYTAEIEAAINKQINMELFASYTYMSMATYFDRDDVALHNISKYFMEQSDEERDHARKLIKYQNKRGGRVVYKSIQQPEKDDWKSPLDAFNAALDLEKNVNASLLEIHLLGCTHLDPNLQDFIDEYLVDQVNSIKEVSDHVTNLIRVGSGLGEYQFDKHFYDDKENSIKQKL